VKSKSTHKPIVKNIPKNSVSKTTPVNNFKFNKPKVDKDLKQQLNNTNKKLEELRNKEVKYKDTIFKLKNNLSSANQELQKEKENNIALSSKLNKYLIKNSNMETEIENLKEQYEKLQQSYTVKAFNILTRDIYNRDKKIIKLQNELYKQSKEYEELLEEKDNLIIHNER
jgi:uncharacterized protein (DUF3084 family)